MKYTQRTRNQQTNSESGWPVSYFMIRISDCCSSFINMNMNIGQSVYRSSYLRLASVLLLRLNKMFWIQNIIVFFVDLQYAISTELFRIYMKNDVDTTALGSISMDIGYA